MSSGKACSLNSSRRTGGHAGGVEHRRRVAHRRPQDGQWVRPLVVDVGRQERAGARHRPRRGPARRPGGRPRRHVGRHVTPVRRDEPGDARARPTARWRRRARRPVRRPGSTPPHATGRRYRRTGGGDARGPGPADAGGVGTPRAHAHGVARPPGAVARPVRRRLRRPRRRWPGPSPAPRRSPMVADPPDADDRRGGVRARRRGRRRCRSTTRGCATAARSAWSGGDGRAGRRRLRVQRLGRQVRALGRRRRARRPARRPPRAARATGRRSCSRAGRSPSTAQGTVITTEQCLLNPNRNPELTRAEIEQGLQAYLGVDRVIWIPFGLADDDDTDGHVDNVACFVAPGVVLVQGCDDPDAPDHERLADQPSVPRRRARRRRPAARGRRGPRPAPAGRRRGAATSALRQLLRGQRRRSSCL